MTRTIRNVFLTACSACVVLSATCAAKGAGEPLELATPGGTFKPYVAENTWSQRWVVVTNNTDSSRKARVVFESKHPTSGQLQYSAVAEIPPHAARRIFLAIRPAKLPALERPLGTNAQFEETALLYDAETGERLGQQTSNIVQFELKDTFLPILLGDIKSEQPRANFEKLKDAPLGKVVRTYATLETLPDRWYGYAMADILVFDNVDTDKLLPSQVEATLDWVQRGGVLVLTGPTRLGAVLSGPLGQSAGVSAAGIHHFTSLKAKGPKANEIGPVAMDQPAPMIELCPDEAEVVFTGNGLPLLTRNRFGDGYVCVISVPLSAIKDPSLHSLWNQMNPARVLRPPVNDNAFDEPARQILNEIAGSPAPSARTPLIILGAFVAATMVGGVLLNFRRRGELLWVVLVPAALLCGLVLWNIGRSAITEERLSHVALITGLETGKARVQCVFGYYSGRDTKEQTFSAGTGAAVIEETGLKAQSAFGRSRTLCGPALMLPEQEVKENSTAMFTVDSVIQTGGVTGALTFDEGGLTGKLTNGLGADIDTAVIYVNDHTYALGDLKDGKATDISVGPDNHLGPVTFIERPIDTNTSTTWESPAPAPTRSRSTTKPARSTFSSKATRTITVAEGDFTGSNVQDALRNEFMAHLIAQGVNVDVGRAMLVGGSETSLVDPLSGRLLRRQGKSVVVWPLQLTSPAPNTKVLIPDGFVTLSYPHVKGYTTMLWNARERKFNPSPRGGEILITATAPNVVGKLRDSSITLTIRTTALGFNLRVWGIDQPIDDRKIVHNSVPLKEVSNPSGEIMVQIDNADRFMQSDGVYVLAIQMEKIATGAAPSVASGDKTSTNWSFESITVRIEGTTR